MLGVSALGKHLTTEGAESQGKRAENLRKAVIAVRMSVSRVILSGGWANSGFAYEAVNITGRIFSSNLIQPPLETFRTSDGAPMNWDLHLHRTRRRGMMFVPFREKARVIPVDAAVP